MTEICLRFISVCVLIVFNYYLCQTANRNYLRNVKSCYYGQSWRYRRPQVQGWSAQSGPQGRSWAIITNYVDFRHRAQFMFFFLLTFDFPFFRT